MIYVSKDLWQSEFEDWEINDVAIRDRNIVCLCLRKRVPHEQASRMWDHDIETTLINLFINRPEKPFGARSFTGFNKPRVGTCTLPLSQALLVARNNDGQVSILGGGRDFPDEFIDPGKVPMTYRVKTLGGYAYSVGGGRAIYKRVDIGKWVKIDQGMPKVDASTAQGFNDLDAFSESDMYAVGGHGDVWHFDGKAWKQMGFPSNRQLATVSCAGDGKVYISGEGGSLWAGRLSTWEPLYEGASSVLWNDVLWFDGRLWLASDYQLRTWDGRALAEVAHQGDVVPIYGHMDARDGLLAVASPWSVMTFDGRAWRTIVAPYVE
jgi:hypothetical protein